MKQVRTSRRSLLRVAAAAGAVAAFPLPFIAGTSRAVAQTAPLKLAWNAGAACLTPIAVADKQGFFTKHGLQVELVNYSGSTDSLLESIATGKVDAGVGMALRWLKPLENGFDVKLTAGIHGGCLRMLAPKGSGLTSLTSLKGKQIGVTDQASPAKNFFSVLLGKNGIDPARDVEWRQYPGNLLELALQKGEIQAIADSDPLAFKFLKSADLHEIATNLTGEYATRTCCLIGVRGSLLRENRPAAAALTRALVDAQQFVYGSPDLAAEAFVNFAPGSSKDDIAAMLRSHAHGHQVLGQDLRAQMIEYADELKVVSVLKPNTDSKRFADRITVDILA